MHATITTADGQVYGLKNTGRGSYEATLDGDEIGYTIYRAFRHGYTYWKISGKAHPELYTTLRAALFAIADEMAAVRAERMEHAERFGL